MFNIDLEDILHVILLLEFIFGLILWSKWAVDNKSKAGYAVAPILFFLHALLFFTLSILNIIRGELLAVWSDLLAVHGVTIMITGIYAMIYSLGSSFRRNKDGKQ